MTKVNVQGMDGWMGLVVVNCLAVNSMLLNVVSNVFWDR